MRKFKLINGWEFYPIPGFPNYYISSLGEVYTMFKHRLLKKSNNNGYKMVFLKDPHDGKGKRQWQYVHRLVAQQFVAIPEHLKDYKGELWVNHKNGSKDINAPGNLEWTTIPENIQHSFDVLMRKVPKGKDHWLYGGHLSDATKKLMSDAKKGDKHPKFKGYYITPKGVFSSSLAASKVNDTCQKTIINRCKSKHPGYS